MKRLEVIQKIINRTGAKRYLEIGVEYGTVFLHAKASRKTAVDPQFKIPFYKKILRPVKRLREKYYQMPSDDFFSRYGNGKKFDVIFIDGLHTYEQSLKDLRNSLAVLNNGGVIIMHDCNPPTRESASMGEASRGSGAWCGDVWKTIVNVNALEPNLKAFVLDTDYGLGIITRGKSQKPFSLSSEEIKFLDYDFLDKNREKVLNLKDVSYFQFFLHTLYKL